MIKNMNTDRNWLLKKAAEEDNAVISVGGLVVDQQAIPVTEKPTAIPHKSMPGFARLIEFSRRKKGLSIQTLAKKADVEENELYEIESGHFSELEPRTVHQLAHILELPVPKLLALSGQAASKDTKLEQASVRFAMKYGNLALSREEQEALEEFVHDLVSD